jgi:beta-galactosidase
MKASRFSLATLLFSLCLSTFAAAPDPAAELRASICLNGEWEIAAATDEVKVPSDGWTLARVPAAPTLDKSVTARWHRLVLDVPMEWSIPGRRFHLGFEKVGHYAAVFCNGQKVGEHFGQYTPFEFDLAEALRPGQKNELAVYVHNALGKFARPGADITDEMVGNAYRPAANQQDQRNWIGIVGDVTLSWRPENGIADVFVETSVREKRINALIELHDSKKDGKEMTLRSAVLDGRNKTFELPSASVGADKMARLGAAWANPVLWGNAPYGEPKLYTLRTELVRDGRVIDRVFTRFGFREVWIDGKDVMLNGKKLWLAGVYHSKLSPLRQLNDRRPYTAVNRAMQTAGLNALHGHWDDLGDPWLDVCDETGMLVMAGFFCDGRPLIQSKADEGWVDWMTEVCAEWVKARRNHPSIVVWRPTDVLPPGVGQAQIPEIRARLAKEVRRLDPSGRPLEDDSEIVGWGQPPDNKGTGTFDNFGPLENAAKSGKPFMCKEIYGGFQKLPEMLGFFSSFYQKSFELGSTGVLVQQMPLFAGQREAFAIQWPSQSGPGNRDVKLSGLRGEIPNWCDSSQPPTGQSAYAKHFGELYSKYMKVDLLPKGDGLAPETLITGLPGKSIVFLAPDDSSLAETTGLMTASDGSAWCVPGPAGNWEVTSGTQHQKIQMATQVASPTMGMR